MIYVEGGEIKNREKIHLLQMNQSLKLNTLVDLGIDVLICNGITDFYSKRLSDSNVEVIPWISGEVEKVLTQYLKGKLIPNDF
jgi:predicted Fe-Mo cluster-binding NifX family protein